MKQGSSHGVLTPCSGRSADVARTPQRFQSFLPSFLSPTAPNLKELIRKEILRNKRVWLRRGRSVPPITQRIVAGPRADLKLEGEIPCRRLRGSEGARGVRGAIFLLPRISLDQIPKSGGKFEFVLVSWPTYSWGRWMTWLEQT